MAVTAANDGVMLDAGGVRWLDTQAMAWDPIPGPDGEELAYYRKVLARTADGSPSIYLQFMPPGFPLKHFQPPYRHYHRTVREQAFLLRGEFPGAEYESADQQHGQLIVKQEGWFMDRDPGSLHGFEPELPNRTGCVFLMWPSGPGLARMEVDREDFEEETVEVPFGDRPPRPDAERELLTARDDGSGVVVDGGGVRWVDTRAMAWEPFFNGETGHYRKILARDEGGHPTVFLHFLPPDFSPGELPYRHLHRTCREFAYVLEGELPGAEYESAEQQRGVRLQKKKGWFIERQPGSIHGIEEGQTTHTGAVLLVWTPDGPGSWIGDENFDVETVHVPYE